jgi:hypothetical protein
MKNMKSVAKFYIAHAMPIGAILFLIPVVAVFLWMFVNLPFREIYVLRFALTAVVGGIIAAFVHRYGISLWVIKHQSQKGPAGFIDGMAIGAAVGLLMALVPPLFSLIQSNHPEQTKTFIIVSYIGGAVAGGLLGGIVSAVGKDLVPRKK